MRYQSSFEVQIVQEQQELFRQPPLIKVVERSALRFAIQFRVREERKSARAHLLTFFSLSFDSCFRPTACDRLLAQHHVCLICLALHLNLVISAVCGDFFLKRLMPMPYADSNGKYQPLWPRENACKAERASQVLRERTMWLGKAASMATSQHVTAWTVLSLDMRI